MRSVTLIALLVVLTVVGQAAGQQPAPNNDQDTRLGLIANQIGVPPVPGGIPVVGIGSQFPGGFPGRDTGCWCQPVNQVCTNLRPENLDLVTRIINRPGSPGSRLPGGGGANGCNEDQRVCCPNNGGFPGGNPDFPGQGGFPGQSGALSAFCGSRQSFGLPAAISPTADFGEYPWMAVVLGPGQSYVSGGVLIDNGWVLTTAHKLAQTQGLEVRLGDYDVSQANDIPQFPPFASPVANVIVHPNYNPQTLANDVALLRLAQPVNRQQYRHITPACLPSPGQSFAGQRCFVTGWGKDAFGPGSFQQLLQEVDVPVLDSSRCESLLKNTRLGPSFRLDKRSFVCAGGERDKDSCQGDGGSPMVCGQGNGGWTVAGLVAWGVGCGQENVPGVYVNVASYANFIRQNVN
ncbi:phenoloxidase-activating factor 2-like [Hyalella azteca]|uniref:Phenoloxidase-activating factor 2-like n=1 Tax=Hyalella azteca TaxID=294128 RepID=A0A8B7N296_HYAAZ|nr:phenoloxidase-activating factor 2-like [Hyalella azteca]